MTLRDIAAELNAEIVGEGSGEIRRVAKIEEAGEGDITFIANPKYARYLSNTRASAVIVGKGVEPPAGSGPVPVLLRVNDPYLSFLKVLQKFHPPASPLPPGIHPSAVISSSALLGHDVRVGAHAVIGERVRIGVGTIVGHGVVLGDDVEIGADVIIYHNVTVYQGCKIGEHVIIHSGTSIGSDGFGFAPRSDGSYEKIPQMGIVVVEDDVEIGANCAIDRATLGETRIKKGAKLDNLIQIAHNVVIGENTVIAAQTGISGSTKIGKNNMIGGQVGFTGHLEIADNTKFGAQSGVHRSVKEPGKTLFGYPAIPHREAARIVAATTQLPEALVTLRELKRTVEVLEERVRTLQGDQIDHPAAKHQE